MASSTGTAARNGQENGSTATPNTSVVIGISRMAATSVNATLTANVAAGRGARRPRGQASSTMTVFRAARPASRMSAPAANCIHDRL